MQPNHMSCQVLRFLLEKWLRLLRRPTQWVLTRIHEVHFCKYKELGVLIDFMRFSGSVYLIAVIRSLPCLICNSIRYRVIYNVCLRHSRDSVVWELHHISLPTPLATSVPMQLWKMKTVQTFDRNRHTICTRSIAWKSVCKVHRFSLLHIIWSICANK